MKQKETPKSPMSGGKGAEVSKTLFYILKIDFRAKSAAKVCILGRNLL